MTLPPPSAPAADGVTRLITVEDAAARWKLSREQIRRWLRGGELRGMRLSDRSGWRIDEADAERFMAARLGRP